MFGISWFKTGSAKQFGITLANDFGRRFPPSSFARTDTGASQQMRGIMQGIATLAMQYCIDQHVGFFGKAALANAFRWRLFDLGYQKELAEEFSAEVAKRMSAT